jgi:hypothetical protein
MIACAISILVERSQGRERVRMRAGDRELGITVVEQLTAGGGGRG